MPVPLAYPVLMPDTPEDIVSEIGNSRALRRLKRELITGAQFQQEFAILRQQRIAEANRRIEHRRLEGIGQKIGEIDSELYFQMMMLYGPDCWADPDFVADTLQKNPWMRIHTRFPTRVLVDGFGRADDKRSERAAGNRITGRTCDALPDLVRVIEHPAAPPSPRPEASP